MRKKTLITYLRSGPGHLFLWGYIFVLLVALVFLLTGSREGIHLAMTRYHTPFLDGLLKYWTFLGDGVLLIALVLVLLLVSYRYALLALVAFAVGGLGAQLLKRLFFSDCPRPVKYFEMVLPDQSLHLVDGVTMHAWHSFPSGHTATAFAILFALALMSRRPVVQALLLLLALGVAFSRVYLSQHFLVDVAGGSVLGMAGGWLAWRWIGTSNRKWADRSLFSRRK